MIDLIAFDADDTLWHNESLFQITQERFRTLLAPFHEKDWVAHQLYETERRNLGLFGYGVKGFTLSMIETAIQMTQGRVTGNEIQILINAAKDMLKAPIKPLPYVQTALEVISPHFRLMIITKGDLFDQESKIARSGLAEFFDGVEVVSEKTTEVYLEILGKQGIAPDSFVMVGNSLKSDILPVVQIGGKAIHVPYKTEWLHEQVDNEELQRFKHRYWSVRNMGELPAALDKIMAKA